MQVSFLQFLRVFYLFESNFCPRGCCRRGRNKGREEDSFLAYRILLVWGRRRRMSGGDKINAAGSGRFPLWLSPIIPGLTFL